MGPKGEGGDPGFPGIEGLKGTQGAPGSVGQEGKILFLTFQRITLFKRKKKNTLSIIRKSLSFLICSLFCKLVKSSDKDVELTVEVKRKLQNPNSASYKFFLFYSNHVSCQNVVLLAYSGIPMSQYYKEWAFQ